MSALDGPGQSPEAGPLAREMAASVRDMVESYLNASGMSRGEAAAKAREPAHPDSLAITLSKPPDEVSWFELENLLERDPERALRRWEEIKQAAREEAGSGHRGAKAVERWGGSPLQLAQ